jgi:lipopolysaccharide transport system permease protein
MSLRELPGMAARSRAQGRVTDDAGRRLRRTLIEPPRLGLGYAWRDFWLHRPFLAYFGAVFLRKRYARTWLGWLWIPLRPSFSVLSKILVFGGLIGISSVDAPYPLFFLIATAGWQLFFECAYWSTRSLELNRSILRVIHVPKLTVISSAAVPALVEFSVYASMAIAAALYYWLRAGYVYVDLSLRTLLVPAGLVLLASLGLGIGFLTATLGASARDIRFALTYVLSFLYFLTPVIYPLSAVPAKYRPLAEINPVTGAIEMVKDGVFASHELSIHATLLTVAAALVVWIPGLWIVHRREVRRSHA